MQMRPRRRCRCVKIVVAAIVLAPIASLPFGAWAEEALKNNRGLAFEAVYKADIVSNVSGGVRRATEYLGNLDLKLTVDAEKAFGWEGVTLFLHALNNHGGKPGENTGSAQGVTNIEAPTATKIFEAWGQKTLLDDKLSLRFGLYDLNSEFYHTETSELFLNDVYGTGKDLSQTGQNGPSIFPTTSLGFRVKSQPMDSLYVQAVVLDGVPGDPDNPKGTHIKFKNGDGALVALELGYRTGADNGKAEPTGKYAIGYWRYTANFDDLTDTDVAGDAVKRDNYGAYLLAEHKLFSEHAGSDQGLAAFARLA